MEPTRDGEMVTKGEWRIYGKGLGQQLGAQETPGSKLGPEELESTGAGDPPPAARKTPEMTAESQKREKPSEGGLRGGQAG